MSISLTNLLNGIIGAAALLAASAVASHAATVTITSASGTWSNITGSPTALTNSGGTITWGTPASPPTDTQNVFSFVGNAPAGPYDLGTSFTLGTFSYLNSSTFGNQLSGAGLNIAIAGTITDGAVSQAFNVTPSYNFSLETTPNTSPTCCADTVTALNNVAGSQPVNFNGVDYVFNFSSFMVGGSALSTLSVDENARVDAQFRGLLTAAVPGPIAGTGLIPLAGFGATWLARRRRKLIARA